MGNDRHILRVENLSGLQYDPEWSFHQCNSIFSSSIIAGPCVRVCFDALRGHEEGHGIGTGCPTSQSRCSVCVSLDGSAWRFEPSLSSF